MNNFNIMTKEQLQVIRVKRPDQELYCQLREQIKPERLDKSIILGLMS